MSDVAVNMFCSGFIFVCFFCGPMFVFDSDFGMLFLYRSLILDGVIWFFPMAL